MNSIFTKTNIDLTSNSPQTLAILGSDTILPFIFFQATQKETTSNQVVISIGSNAPEYNNWLQNTEISDLEVGEFHEFSSTRPKKVFSQNDEIFIRVVHPCVSPFKLTAFGFGFPINS